MAKKETKILTKRKKFIEVDIPTINSKIELVGETHEELAGRRINLDLTRQLRGKSIEGFFKVELENKKLIANPTKIRLMPYFIRRMIRKRISYIEDSFKLKTQQSLITIKPFLITRKRVSRAVRKTIRNQARNWLEDYCAERTDLELFQEIFTGRLQKPLSLRLKKTYPLSLCEIRILEIVRPLETNEIPKVEKKKKEEKKQEKIEEGLDQMAEIEAEIKQKEVKEAEEEIKETQKKAVKKEEEIETEEKPVKKKASKKKAVKE